MIKKVIIGTTVAAVTGYVVKTIFDCKREEKEMKDMMEDINQKTEEVEKMYNMIKEDFDNVIDLMEKHPEIFENQVVMEEDVEQAHEYFDRLCPKRDNDDEYLILDENLNIMNMDDYSE